MTQFSTEESAAAAICMHFHIKGGSSAAQSACEHMRACDLRCVV